LRDTYTRCRGGRRTEVEVRQRFGLTETSLHVTHGPFEAVLQLTEREWLDEPGRELSLHQGPHLVGVEPTVVQVGGVRKDVDVTLARPDALRQLVVTAGL